VSNVVFIIIMHCPWNQEGIIMANVDNEDIERWPVWDSVVATLKVNADANKLSYDDKESGEKVYYLTCRRLVPGGKVMIYVFADDLDSIKGKIVAANIELKTRKDHGKIEHYLRAQVIGNGKDVSHKLYVGSADDPNVNVDKSLPSRLLRELGKKVLIGFIPV
jgi:hypothetical protein